MRRYAWTHFITLTTAEPFTVPALMRAAERYLTRIGATSWFWCIEGGGATGGQPHVHLVAYIAGKTTIDQLRSGWPHGLVDVMLYDPEQGGTTYIAKGFRKSDYYDVSSTMPPRRPRARRSPRSTSTITTTVVRSLDAIDLEAWLDRYARAIVDARAAQRAAHSEAA